MNQQKTGATCLGKAKQFKDRREFWSGSDIL